MMIEAVSRIANDVKTGRNIEVYVTVLISGTVAILSVVGDRATEKYRWAAVLAALGLLLYKTAIPTNPPNMILRGRTDFNAVRFEDRLRQADNVWLLAPSGINILTPDNIESIRKQVLSQANGSLRIVTLNPKAKSAVAIAHRQLYASLDYRTQTLSSAIRETTRRIQAMVQLSTPGIVEHRLLDFSPGFSLFAVNPGSRDGCIVVEFHGFHTSTTAKRMHIELTRSRSEIWYDYWVDQFEQAWQQASFAGVSRRPEQTHEAGQGPTTGED